MASLTLIGADMEGREVGLALIAILTGVQLRWLFTPGDPPRPASVVRPSIEKIVHQRVNDVKEKAVARAGVIFSLSLSLSLSHSFSFSFSFPFPFPFLFLLSFLSFQKFFFFFFFYSIWRPDSKDDDVETGRIDREGRSSGWKKEEISAGVVPSPRGVSLKYINPLSDVENRPGVGNLGCIVTG